MKDLKIIVCLKPVPDPECPASSLEINRETKTILPIGVPPVINPYDENALEAALKVKDATGAKVIAVTMVEKQPGGVFHKVRTGADELVVLQDAGFKDLDSYSTALVLATAIQKISGYDLILTGRQSADWSSGLVGSMIAEILNIPSITIAKGVRIEEDSVIVEKLKKNGYEILKTSMPALITMSSEIGDLRLFPLKAINEARKKPMTVWGKTDIKINPEQIAIRKIFALSPPPSRKRDCMFINGQSPEEKGEVLAQRLRQDRVI
jgi:electron transfer flavoprotein beta subunit